MLYVSTRYNSILSLHTHSLDTGIIGPVSDMDYFRQEIATTSPIVLGLIVSSVLLPSAIVSFFAGNFADAVGRPRAVTMGFCIFALGAAIEAGSIHIAMFIVGRIIIGIGNGLSLSTVVVYICELAPPNERGVLTTLVQLLSATGILVGYFICYGTVRINSAASWRLPLALQLFLAFLFAAVCVPLPQSPRWLTLCGRHEEARSLWIRLGINPDSEDTDVSDGLIVEKDQDPESNTEDQSSKDTEVSDGVVLRKHKDQENKTDGQPSEDIGVSGGVVIERHKDLRSKIDNRSGESPAAVLRNPTNNVLEDTTEILSRSVVRVFRKDVRSRTALGVYYLGMQQLSGMDSILYYAPIVFQHAGITSQQSSSLASGVISIVIVVVTVPATLSADSWSRRTQTIVGGCLISGCLFLNGILYAAGAVHQDSGAAWWVVIVTIYAYVISYCVTWAMSVRSYPSEIQPPATRATATSLAQSAIFVSR